jgi:hypothetical protein
MKEYIRRRDYTAVKIFEEELRVSASSLPPRLPGYRNLEHEMQTRKHAIVGARVALLRAKGLFSVKMNMDRDPGFRMSVATTLQLDFFGRPTGIVLAISEPDEHLPQLYISVLEDLDGPFIALTANLQYSDVVRRIADQISGTAEELLEAYLLAFCLFNPAGLILPAEFFKRRPFVVASQIEKIVSRQKYEEVHGRMQFKELLTPRILDNFLFTANPLRIRARGEVL